MRIIILFIKIYSEKSVFELKVIYNVDNSRGKATMDILNLMKKQYDANNNNKCVVGKDVRR